ncbi:MAG: mechanosensitive ion channel [Muribaculaceae bacterium]|nr:mechanosensitive ion channel [Muribaculaceae bacterium]
MLLFEEQVDSTQNVIEQELELFEPQSISDLVHQVTGGLVKLAINIVIAIIVFYVGRWIIRKLTNLVASILVRREVELSLTTFILSLVKIVLYFILIVTIIGILGLETSSFLALFASAGVAIGMALSGTLQNFAGGVLILLLKPYKIGDYIEAQGYTGTVREIQIFSTVIITADNKTIIIPNGPLSTGSINNWSKDGYRRVVWNVGISYGDKVENAREAILEMFANDERIIKGYIDDDREARMEEEGKTVNIPERVREIIPKKDGTPTVVLNELADSSVALQVRAWVRTENYWDVFYHYNEMFYNELPKHGINFPFPQLDVHFDKPT